MYMLVLVTALMIQLRVFIFNYLWCDAIGVYLTTGSKQIRILTCHPIKEETKKKVTSFGEIDTLAV